MTFLEKQQIISIRNKIPDQWIDLTNTNQLGINIVPNRKVKLVGSDMNIFFLARIVISIKPSSESRDIPIGFERWCVDLQLDKLATTHTFTPYFNYKILSKILPTKYAAK